MDALGMAEYNSFKVIRKMLDGLEMADYISYILYQFFQNSNMEKQFSIGVDLVEAECLSHALYHLLNIRRMYAFMKAVEADKEISIGEKERKMIDSLEKAENISYNLSSFFKETKMDALKKPVEAKNEISIGENVSYNLSKETALEEVVATVKKFSKRRFRNEIRNSLENLPESCNDESKLYTKTLFVLKPISTFGSSLLIEDGGYKWSLRVCRNGSSLSFVLDADTYDNPRLYFYALLTSAIIHPLDPRITDCFDAFLSVSKANSSYLFDHAGVCENGFLDAQGNVKVELQIQVFGENVFPPLLVRKFRIELFLTYTDDVNEICSRFIEKTKENLKSLIQDKNKWSRFCTFMKECGQISKDQMFCEKQDVIKESLVEHFFVEGVVTSPLLMEILYYGYQSINANNTTAKFVRIEENRFELVGDVPSLFMSVVGTVHNPIKVNVPTVEDYESIFTKLGCMIVEIYVLDYLFRNKIEVNFTRSELIQTEKKSKKKGKEKAKSKKNDKRVEENKQKQNDESVAAGLKDDTVRAKLLDLFMNALENHEVIATTVRDKLLDLFMNALENHEVISTTLKEKIDALIAKHRKYPVAVTLDNVVTELYSDAKLMVAVLYVGVEKKILCWNTKFLRNAIRECLESHDFDESGNDVSKQYTKKSLTLKPISGSVIKHGEYKWIFKVCEKKHSLQFVLLPDTYSINPKLNFYALITLAIIHPLDPRLTDCFDAFSFVGKGCTGNVFVLPDAWEKGFLDAKGNVQVELQIQVTGENVFPPLLVRKFRRELVLAYATELNCICFLFFERTRLNLRSLVDDENKWSRFCTFMKERGQISKDKDQMFCEKEDVIKERLVNRFCVDGDVVSLLLMEILHNGYQSINANNTTATFVRIEENKFELVGDDVPDLFKRVVGTEFNIIQPDEEEYESNLTKLGCLIVEIYVVDYLFRNKIEVNFFQTEKKSKKEGKEKQNDVCRVSKLEFIAGLEEDMSVPKMVRAKLSGSVLLALNSHRAATTSLRSKVRDKLVNLFMKALKDHDVVATTLKETINALVAEQEEHVACELVKAVTELYMEAQEKVAAFFVERNKILVSY